MLNLKKSIFLAITVLFGSSSQATQCLDLLRFPTTTPVLFTHSLKSYEDLKKHPMWIHESPTLHNNLIRAFLDQTTENNGDTLFKILFDLKESQKLPLLNQAQKLLESSMEMDFARISLDRDEFLSISKQLENRFDIILDFKLDASPRIKHFTFGSQVLIRDLSELQKHINKTHRERELLLTIFESITEIADETIRTSRYIDPSSVDIKPFPERITLLSYTIRHQYLDLFELLVHSPQVLEQLHLDYSVLLLDEVEKLPSSNRSLYRKLVNKTFSPEALNQYNKGQRGANGIITIWDKIDFKTY